MGGVHMSEMYFLCLQLHFFYCLQCPVIKCLLHFIYWTSQLPGRGGGQLLKPFAPKHSMSRICQQQWALFNLYWSYGGGGQIFVNNFARLACVNKAQWLFATLHVWFVDFTKDFFVFADLQLQIIASISLKASALWAIFLCVPSRI